MNKLINIIQINGVLTIKSGLSIGGQKNGIGIDAKDNPIVKNPLDNKPYIPGSSIKGKMRSLYEINGLAQGNTFPCECGKETCNVCKLFGAHKNTKPNSGNPRLLFRDATLRKEYYDMDEEQIIEIKTETMIDRVTGLASNSTLRERERIAAGVKFDYTIDILVFEGDDEGKLIELVKNGLKLIELTGLGGKTSAGYGQVDFGLNEETYEVIDKLQQ